MIRSTLFRKHFAIAAASVLGFVLIGSILSTFLIQRMIKDRAMDAPMFFVRLIEELGNGDPVAGVKKMESFEDERFPFKFSVYNEKRERIYGTSTIDLPPVLPQGSHESISLGGTGMFGASITRLNHSPALYLVATDHNEKGPRRPPGNGPGFKPPPIFLAAFLTLVITVTVGVGFALFLIFRSLREHVETADRVISELQNGNLKARFPIKKQDEIGNAMARFNQMADQIEQLVEKVRAAEKSRNFLLQELTHDLRTPVAAMRSLLETIFSEANLSEEMQELSDLAMKETDYISRLVEDLLLLAQVSEPKYKPSQDKITLASLLEEEGEALTLKRGGAIRFIFRGPESEAVVSGNEQLMQRLVRNALENAFSYARSQVEVSLHSTSQELGISIADDGPGFDSSSLENFGERRNQRIIAKNTGGRLSLGLGSVIMKTIVTLHGGRMKAFNSPNGGAVIEIYLPKA